MDEQNELDVIIHDYKPGESGFSFDSVNKLPTGFSKYHDVGQSTYCIILKRH